MAYRGNKYLRATAIHTDGIAEVGAITTAGTGGYTFDLTFSNADCNGTAHTLTLSQDIPTWSAVRFTAGSTALPANLSAGTTYYLRRISANVYSVHGSVSLAQQNLFPHDLTPVDGGGSTGHHIIDFTYHNYEDVPVVGGSGEGAEVRVTTFQGAAVEWYMTKPGKGYVEGESVELDASDIGGVTGFEGDILYTGIAPSRESATAPAHFQFVLSGCTVEGYIVDKAGNVKSGLVVRSFQDPEITWDMDDPNGTEIFTDYTVNLPNGWPVNMNIGQRGPSAKYMYRTPSTTPIARATIRCIQPDGTYLTAVAEREVTVNAYPTLFYFNMQAAFDGNGNTAADAASNGADGAASSIAKLVTAINAGKRCLIKRGSTVTGTVNIGTCTGASIGTYSTGAKPIWQVAAVASCLAIASTQTIIDFTVSDQHFKSDVTQSSVAVINLYAQGLLNASGITLDNCDITLANNDPFGATKDGFVIGPYRGCALWGGTITGQTVPLTSGKAYNATFQSGTRYFMAVTGVTINGVGGTPGNPSPHVFYCNCQGFESYSFMKISVGDRFDDSLHLRCDSALHMDSPYPCHFYHISNTLFDNVGTTNKAIYDIAILNGNNLMGEVEPTLNQGAGYRGVHADVVIDQCVFKDLGPEANHFCVNMSSRSFTMRDCWAFGPVRLCGVSIYAEDITDTRVYNSDYFTAGVAGYTGMHFTGSDTDWSAPRMIVDNNFQNNHTVARTLEVKFSDTDGDDPQTFIDGNKHWGPNDADGRMVYNNTTSVTMNDWQGQNLDATDGGNVNPGFSDPANGYSRVPQGRVKFGMRHAA